MRHGRIARVLGAALGLRAAGLGLLWMLALVARAGEASDEFDRQRFKEALAHEIAFRAAALQVAWGAEPLCDDTSEIEPFVLWSLDGVRSGLSAHQRALFTQATGMDEKWRIAWLDESAPDALELGDAVVAVNGRPLPPVSAKVEVGAVFRGGSTVAVDDRAFWDVMHQARDEAINGSSMTLTLATGRTAKVATQTGCAGSVMATAFDDEPENLLRQEGSRVKLPGNALREATTRDEYRWLAAFGTYFIASARSIIGQQDSEAIGNGFAVGKVLTLALPGMGTLLMAVQIKAEREIMVDGLVGYADLFADEVVMALGGDPEAGLRLSERLRRSGVKADVIVMTDFRRSNVELHVRQLNEIARLRDAVDRQGEAAERGEAAAEPDAAPAPARGGSR